MRKIIVLCFALTLGACANGQLINPFQTITNPVSNNNLYEGELVFDATLKTFIELKGLCANRVLPSTCRTYVKKGQVIITQIYGADKAARSFIKNNPTLDATNVVQAFTNLVSTFKDTVTALSASK
jgi:hypothetical protein